MSETPGGERNISAEILKTVLERRRREGEIADEGSGLTFHFVEAARTIGPARRIEGYILVEDASGKMARIDGVQLRELHEKNPWIAKNWRLSSDDRLDNE